MTLGVFRDVRFCIDLVNMALVFLAMAAYTFIFPYYLQEARGIGAGAAGLIMACYPLVNSIVGPVSGAVSDKVGCEKPTLVGQTIYTCGLAACSFLALGTPIPLLICCNWIVPPAALRLPLLGCKGRASLALATPAARRPAAADAYEYVHTVAEEHGAPGTEEQFGEGDRGYLVHGMVSFLLRVRGVRHPQDSWSEARILLRMNHLKHAKCKRIQDSSAATYKCHRGFTGMSCC